MPFALPVFGAWGDGGRTQAAGTAILILIPPRSGAYTRLTHLVYTSLGTAHALTVMRELARTTLSGAAAAAQLVINLTRDPGLYAANAILDGRPVPSVADNAIAANDFVIIKKPDGTYHVGKVTSVAALAVTLAANVPTGGFDSGSTVWFMGAAGDTDPNTGLTHPPMKPAVSARTLFLDSVAGIIGGVLKDSPLLLHSDNATAAGVVDQVSAVWTTK